MYIHMFREITEISLFRLATFSAKLGILKIAQVILPYNSNIFGVLLFVHEVNNEISTFPYN